MFGESDLNLFHGYIRVFVRNESCVLPAAHHLEEVPTRIFVEDTKGDLPNRSCIGSRVRLSVEDVLPLESTLVTGHNLRHIRFSCANLLLLKRWEAVVIPLVLVGLRGGCCLR